MGTKQLSYEEILKQIDNSPDTYSIGIMLHAIENALKRKIYIDNAGTIETNCLAIINDYKKENGK